MFPTMTSKQRAIAAMNFREADRVPRYFSDFWPEFEANWKQVHGPTDLHKHFGDDMRLVEPCESAWPTRAGLVEWRGDRAVVRSGWGELKLTQFTAPAEQVMGELIEPAVKERIDPEKLRFDDPLLDSRFERAGKEAAALKDEYFVWCKSGGPYLRAAFMRGEEQFWMDVVEDPGWTRAFVDRVVDHIVAVAIGGLRRFGLQDTGIAIYDDVASSSGPFVGPKHYEQVFLPALRRMVKAYQAAGARWVMHHSDGNVLSLLDMWVDAGINAINPIEFRTGMDPLKIRRQFGNRLVCTGGMDNCEILPRGDRGEIRDHILLLLEAGRGGGFIFGTQSIGPDIRVETMEYVLELLAEYGKYPLQGFSETSTETNLAKHFKERP
jgi:uroporphyrinogen-III decarboxylase